MVKYQGPLLDEQKWLEASRKACQGRDFTILSQQPVRNPQGIQSYIGQIRCNVQAAPSTLPTTAEPAAVK